MEIANETWVLLSPYLDLVARVTWLAGRRWDQKRKKEMSAGPVIKPMTAQQVAAGQSFILKAADV